MRQPRSVWVSSAHTGHQGIVTLIEESSSLLLILEFKCLKTNIVTRSPLATISL